MGRYDDLIKEIEKRVIGKYLEQVSYDILLKDLDNKITYNRKLLYK